MSNGPGGLKVGDLYVSVTASIGDMAKTLGQVADAVEETADAIEGHLSKASAALGDFSEGLLSFAAVGAAAFAVASQSSAPAAEALEELKTATTLLGREVGDLLVPTVRELTGYVKTAIATWRGLDSEMKAQLVTAVRYAAVVGVAGLALSRGLIFVKSFAEGTVVLVRTVKPLIGLAGGLGNAFAAVGAAAQKAGWALVYLKQASVGQVFASLTSGAASLKTALVGLPGTLASIGKGFMGLLPQIAAVGLPVLAVAAAVAGLVLLAGSLYKNWDELSMLLRESTADMVGRLVGLAETVSTFFSGLWNAFKAFVIGAAVTTLEQVANVIRIFSGYLSKITGIFAGKSEMMKKATDFLKGAENITGQGLVEVLMSGGASAAEAVGGAIETAGAAVSEATKGFREGVKSGLKDSAQGAKMLGADLAKSMGLDSMLADLKALAAKLGGVQLGDGSKVELPQEMETGKVVVDGSDFLDKLKRWSSPSSNPVLKALREKLQSEALSAVSSVTGALVAQALKVRESAQQMADAMAQARDSLKGQFMSRTGDVGSLIETGMQGAAAGGAIGALVAVIADLVSRSEGFTTLVDMAGVIIQSLADALGAFLVPLQPLMGAVSMVVSAVGTALTPILTILGQVVEPLVPVVGMVGVLLSALAPVFSMLGIAMQLVLAPVRLLVGVGLRVLFEALKVVGQMVLHVAMLIGQAWNGIVWEVQNIFRKLSAVSLAGVKPFAGLADLANDMESLKAPIGEMESALGSLRDATWDSVDAAAAEEAARLKNTQALDRASESLTNVPNWRKELRRFQAADASGPSPTMPSSQPRPPAPGPASPGTSQPPAAAGLGIVMEEGAVVINARDPDEALSALERKLDDLSFRNKGTRGRAGRYSYEGR